ncbi:hypothetical protein ACFLST_01825 [Chloroflexota bacterium]
MKKAIPILALLLLLAAFPACGANTDKEPVKGPVEVVKEYIAASQNLDPEQMASYWIPEKHEVLVPSFADSVEHVVSIVNLNVRTELTSEKEHTAIVFAKWSYRTELDDGTVTEKEASLYFNLEKRDNRWLIAPI